MPRPRIRAGDLIAVPFDKGQTAVGLVLLRSRSVFKGCLIVGFYDMAFGSVEEIAIEALRGAFIATPNYLYQWSVNKGFWPLIGHRSDLLDTAPLPLLRVSYDLYRGDEHVRRLTPEELHLYLHAGPQGDGYVELFLRKHFLADGGR